jgi:hypothetical protein
VHRLLRLLRRHALGDERRLARRADRRGWSPSLSLLRRFEREFLLGGEEKGVVFGRLLNPRAHSGWIGLTPQRLREVHLVGSGATGSGKTTAGMDITRQLLAFGGVKLTNMDPKGDTSAALEGLHAASGDEPAAASGLGEVKFFRPFDRHVVPQLRLTAREAQVPAEVQALSLVSSLEEATGAELGLRMRSIATPLATAAIELGLPLSVIVDWLGDPRAFRDAAAGVPNERLQEYAQSQFPKESRESVSAIRSRLEAVLLLPIVRRALEARTFLPLEDWIERFHLNFDWSRPPAGQEAAVRALCGPVMGRLTRALLNRAPGPTSPHILLLGDELQEILGRFETVGVGRLMALARSRGVSCFFMFQQRSQLPRDLQELLRTNATVELVFRANHRDAATYAHSLPVAEDEPDAARVRASLVRRLERLPRRQFLLIVKDSPHGGQFLEAPEINIPRVDRPGDHVSSCGEPEEHSVSPPLSLAADPAGRQASAWSEHDRGTSGPDAHGSAPTTDAGDYPELG